MRRPTGTLIGMDVEALVFDVFGTVVDWRGGVARQAPRLPGPGRDPAALADAAPRWRSLAVGETWTLEWRPAHRRRRG